MTPAAASLSLLANPEWLAHRYLADDNALRLCRVSRARHGEIPFLTDEYLGDDREIADISWDRAVREAEPGPVHFLFHSAFCASTLLVRALDAPGIAMGLSEPVLLNDIVGRRRRREIDVPGTAALFDGALTVLGRPWSPGEAVVIKPSNILNPLAAGLLALRPEAKAIVLFAPLETFLTSVARKGMFCRLWVRELLDGLIQDQAVDFGFSGGEYFRQTDLQCAAIGWLAQHRLFQALIARFGPGRVRALSSEALLGDPAATITATGRHFDLPLSAERAVAISRSEVFRIHSKSREGFDADRRAVEYEKVRAAHGEEIAMAAEWARTVANQFAIPFALDAALVCAPG